MLAPWKKTLSNLHSILKNRYITLLAKVHLGKMMVFPIVTYYVRVGLWIRWAPNNRRFWTMVLEKSLESSLAWKVIQPLNPKGNQSWIFIGITDAEAESPVHWPTDVKNWLCRKDSDAGKDWRQEKKRTTEYEMIEWHHWLDGHEFEQSPRNWW